MTPQPERVWDPRVGRALELARQLEDRDLYQLHREVSRLATRARLRDPAYLTNQRTGYALSRGLLEQAREAGSSQP